MSREEFRFTVQERRDKLGDKYLFGSIRFFNAVIFIRELPTSEGEAQLYECSVKPYQSKEDMNRENDAWEEEESDNGNRRTSANTRRRT